MKKGFKTLLAEANASVEAISVHDASRLVGDGDTVFVDVREQHEWAQGHVPGALHAPRGFLEFIADPEGPMHKPQFASGKRLVVYCGSGGRSALAARTLDQMGVPRVVNLVGGFQAWVQSGSPVES